MHLIICPDLPQIATHPAIFLAGPSSTLRAGLWRCAALAYLRDVEFDGTVLYPEPVTRRGNVSVAARVEWDFAACAAADVVAFWIPRNLPRLPGLTSNFELGLWLRSGKVVLGAPPGADAMDYLLHAAQRAGVRCATTLAETLDLALQLTKSS